LIPAYVTWADVLANTLDSSITGVIYDSDEPGARLIGIEYVVSEGVFVALPEEEKKYWHR